MDLEHVQPVQSLTPDRRSRVRTAIAVIVPMVLLVGTVAVGMLGEHDSPLVPRPSPLAQAPTSTPAPAPSRNPAISTLPPELAPVDAQGFPRRALNLTVRSVAETVDLRDRGVLEDDVVAVAGWLTVPPERACGTDLAKRGPGLYGQGAACSRTAILTDSPDPVLARTYEVLFELTPSAPTLRPTAMPGVSLASIAAGQAPLGRGTFRSQPAVVLGRFSDPRLVGTCPAAECSDTFVLERVIWLDGSWRLRRPELFPHTQPADVSGTVRWPIVNSAIRRALILSEVVVSRAELAALDPVADRHVPDDVAGTVWYIRAVLRQPGIESPSGELAWAVIEDATGFVLASEPDRRSASAAD